MVFEGEESTGIVCFWLGSILIPRYRKIRSKWCPKIACLRRVDISIEGQIRSERGKKVYQKKPIRLSRTRNRLESSIFGWDQSRCPDIEKIDQNDVLKSLIWEGSIFRSKVRFDRKEENRSTKKNQYDFWRRGIDWKYLFWAEIIPDVQKSKN